MRSRHIAVAAFLALAACGSTTSVPLSPSTKSLFAIATGVPGWPPVKSSGSGPATVKLVDAQGNVHATASFQPPPVPVLGPVAALLQSPVRTAAGAAYYADSTGAIHKLAADGSQSVVATFPLTTSQQELTYAVSPDGAHLIAIVLTNPPVHNPPPQSLGDPVFVDGAHWTLTLETADAGGPTTTTFQKDLGTTAIQPTVVVGWDNRGPLATLNSLLANQGGVLLSSHFFGQSGDGAELIHLGSDGTHLDRIGGADCLAVDEIADGTVACGSFQAPEFTVRSTSGVKLWQASLPPDASFIGPWLSPDGKTIAAQNLLITQGAVASAPGRKAGELFALGWLDKNTLVEATPTGQLSLYNAKDFKKIRDLGVSGMFEGLLTPG